MCLITGRVLNVSAIIRNTLGINSLNVPCSPVLGEMIRKNSGPIFYISVLDRIFTNSGSRSVYCGKRGIPLYFQFENEYSDLEFKLTIRVLFNNNCINVRHQVAI